MTNLLAQPEQETLDLTKSSLLNVTSPGLRQTQATTLQAPSHSHITRNKYLQFITAQNCAAFKKKSEASFTRSVVDRLVADRTGESTTWKFNKICGSSRPVVRPERCDQAVAHAQWSAMDRNSVITLFLLYRHRKRRRKGLYWVRPVIQKREEFGAFYRLLRELRDEANKFLNYFQMSVSSFDEMHRRLKESLRRRNSKMWNCIQHVEMLAVAIR